MDFILATSNVKVFSASNVEVCYSFNIYSRVLIFGMEVLCRSNKLVLWIIFCFFKYLPVLDLIYSGHFQLNTRVLTLGMCVFYGTQVGVVELHSDNIYFLKVLPVLDLIYSGHFQR